MPKSLIKRSSFTTICSEGHSADQPTDLFFSDPCTMSERQNLFPTLGEVASRTDALKDVEDDDERLKEGAKPREEQEEGDEREMHEIESLCMRCHEQVGDSESSNMQFVLIRDT